MKKRFLIISVISALAVLVIDQFSKYFAIKKIPDSGIFLWEKFLSFDLTYNYGISFGINFPAWTITILTVGLIALLLYFFYNQFKQSNFFISLLISLAAAAAISNFADRLFHGGVVDFISIQINSFTWPSFNFADIVITVCAIVLIITFFRNEKTPFKDDVCN